MDRAALAARYLDEVRRLDLRAGELLGDLPELKPYCYEGRHLSRPLFIGAAECQRLHADVENVRSALLSLPARLFDGDFTAFAHAAGAYGAVAAVLTGQDQPHTRLGRADLYATSTGFRLLEFNNGGGVGGVDNAEMCRALLRHPVLAGFARTHGLGYVDTARSQVETMLAETGLDLSTRPVVAVSCWPERDGRIAKTFLEEMSAEWQQFGVDAQGCDLGELSCRQGRVWLRDRPVDAIFRMFYIAQLHGTPRAAAMLAPVLAAAARGEVRLCPPLECDIFSSKAALAMVSDDAHRHLFTAAELDSIDRIVPWTRLVRPGPVTVPDGSRAELLDYAFARQDELILKPSIGFAGTGVIPGWEDLSRRQWRALIESVSDPWYVLQERVRPEPELFPGEDGGLVAWSPVWGMFTGTRGYGGMVVRAVPSSDAGVINQGRGAYMGCCLSAGQPGNHRC